MGLFHVIPLPAQMQGSVVAVDAPFELRWQSAVCRRTEAFARNMLADAKVGVVEIDVRECCTGLPTVEMDESYTLTRTQSGCRLVAATTWGALRGIATLYFADGGLPDEVQDSPRFAWRGVSLDVARHFISAHEIKRTIAGMALLKLNVLHLHLTDDQAFRLKLDCAPELAGDEHYARSAIDELVSYAADHGVRVVPEIDVPGHVTAWLVAHPEWGQEPVQPTNRFGVHKACLNPHDEAVYTALEAIFAEVGEWFPDDYLHLGGDEVHPAWWTTSEDIQVYAERLQISPEDLQNRFNQRLCGVLREQGKVPIGWDEVLHQDMPDMVVQNWRGVTTRDRALNKGLDAIISAPYYLDLHYANDMYYAYDPQGSQAELVQLEDEHRLDPRLAHVAAGIEWTHMWRKQAEERQPGSGGRVLGGEACMWSELVDERTLFVRLFSRLPSVAERLWSPDTVTDAEDFYTRLGKLWRSEYFDLDGEQRSALIARGLSETQAGLVMLLEPVKWYGRLLGEEALAARLAGEEMPQARPYKVDTPLDRAVDLIAPESLSARALADADDATWQRLAAEWTAVCTQDWPEDVQPAIDGLGQFGRFIKTPGESVESAWDYYGPHGEFVLAVVPAWINWCENRG